MKILNICKECHSVTEVKTWWGIDTQGEYEYEDGHELGCMYYNIGVDDKERIKKIANSPMPKLKNINPEMSEFEMRFIDNTPYRDK